MVNESTYVKNYSNNHSGAFPQVKLQNFLRTSLKESLYDKGLNTMQLWLSAHDRDDEGNWRDFYTNEQLQNYTVPWDGSGPDGKEQQNCAFLLDENTWGDASCSANFRACKCKHDPNSQGGRSWQAFGGGKKCHQFFRQRRIC